MPWPGPVDYTDELQNPHLCFRDPELRECTPTITALGIPNLITGNFAGVCEFHSRQRRWAVRCFLREVSDQSQHYQEISNYLDNFNLQEFVFFKYLAQGIKVRGEWYPIVKMEWVEGKPLNVFLEHHLQQPQALLGFAGQWRLLLARMQNSGLAHGDLQHGNVLVIRDGKIKLVDYDAVYVPTTTRKKSPELGHHNYQHPNRSGNDFDRRVDNFSALVIYLSLLALAYEPKLWEDFSNNENLILARGDYRRPHQSNLIKRLEQSKEELVRHLVQCLVNSCQGPVSQVPDLETILTQANPAVTPVPAFVVDPQWVSHFLPRPQPIISPRPAVTKTADFQKTPVPVAPRPAVVSKPIKRYPWIIALFLATPLVILVVYLLMAMQRTVPPVAITPTSPPVQALHPATATVPRLPEQAKPTSPPAASKAPAKPEPPAARPPKKVRKSKPPVPSEPTLAQQEPPRRSLPPPQPKSEPTPNFRFGTPEVRKIR